MPANPESFSVRHAFHKRPAWQALAVLYVVGVGLNYPWELAQASLFTAGSHTGNIWLHCFVAGLGDGVMIWLLFGLGWLVLGRRDWFLRPGPGGYAVLLVTGASLAVFVEWTAVHVLQKWTYAEGMPLIPGLDIGLVPIFQMILLPPIIFRIAAVFLGRHTGSAAENQERKRRHPARSR